MEDELPDMPENTEDAFAAIDRERGTTVPKGGWIEGPSIDLAKVEGVDESPTYALDRWARIANGRGFFDMKDLTEVKNELEKRGQYMAHLIDPLFERIELRGVVDGDSVMNAMLDIRNITAPYPKEEAA